MTKNSNQGGPDIWRKALKASTHDGESAWFLVFQEAEIFFFKPPVFFRTDGDGNC